MHTPDASKKLRAWRESRAPKTTLAAAGGSVGVKHSSWSEWESGSRTPSLEKALSIEDITDGAVRVEDWGFDPEVVHVMRRVLRARSNDTGEVIIVREGFDQTEAA